MGALSSCKEIYREKDSATKNGKSRKVNTSGQLVEVLSHFLTKHRAEALRREMENRQKSAGMRLRW
jgi:hypothetical protein